MSFTKDELLEMPLTKLRELCKVHEISGCYKFKSADKERLVDLILAAAPKGSAKGTPKGSPKATVISKAEISKMTVKKLKELLQGCGQITTGLKAELVDRVFLFCRDNLGKPKTPPQKKSLTVKELKDLLERKNIKHYSSKLKKNELEYLANSKTCSIETNDFCAANEICDLRDGICTKPEYIKGDVAEVTIRGHKIVGTKEQIQKITTGEKTAPPTAKKLSKKDLVDLLEQKGIKHSMGLGLKKDELESMLKSAKCNPENNVGCPDDQVCDLRDGFCVNPSYVKKTGVFQKSVDGIKVLGDKDMIEKLEKKLSLKKIVSFTPTTRVLQEEDEDTTFFTPPRTIFPELPKISIPKMPKIAVQPVSGAKMPKISSKTIKPMVDADIHSTVSDRIKASLGLTTL